MANSLAKLRATGAVEQFQKAAPAHFDAARLVRVATTMIETNPNLLKCSELSVLDSMMQCSFLGLMLGRTADLIPFKTTCTLSIRYTGMIELAIRSGMVKSMDARVVYGGDEFSVSYGASPTIHHVPDFSPDADRSDNNIVAFYCIAFLGDGTFKGDVMTKGEVEDVRDNFSRKDSKNQFSAAWRKSFAEMGKAKVVRRACKTLPQSSDMMRALEVDGRSDTEFHEVLEGETAEQVRARMLEDHGNKLSELTEGSPEAAGGDEIVVEGEGPTEDERALEEDRRAVEKEEGDNA